VEAVMASIKGIFNMIDCDESTHIDLLGNRGVTEGNMMTYMGIIEQKINEILRANAFI